MSSFLGFGTAFYGKKYFNLADKSYITIEWTIIALLPFIPLRACRVIRSGTKGHFGLTISATTYYKILGEVPLKANIDLILFTYLKVYGGIITFILGFGCPILFLIPITLIIHFFISESRIK